MRSAVLRATISAAAPAPAGAAVVLVHGIGMSHRSLGRLHERLATTRTVVSVDMPGHGRLPAPARDLTVSEAGAALAELLAELGLGPVVLLGHSMGAQWVTEAALHRPDLVERLVLVGPVTDPRHRTVLRQGLALALDTLGEPPGANLIVLTDYLRCGIPWYIAQLRHMISYRLDERLARVRMPVLVIRGGRDPIAGRDWCRSLAASAARATVVRIPAHGHVCPHTAPGAVASAVLAAGR